MTIEVIRPSCTFFFAQREQTNSKRRGPLNAIVELYHIKRFIDIMEGNNSTCLANKDSLPIICHPLPGTR